MTDVETWELSDADGKPLPLGVDPDGNLWLAGQRLTPEIADNLVWLLRDANRYARELIVPAALAELFKGGYGGTATMIAAKLTRVIRAGEYAPGAMLPTAADLNSACRVTVNQGTVDKAGSILAKQGLAEQGPDGRYRVAGAPDGTP